MPSSDVLREYYGDYNPTQTSELAYRTHELPRLHDPIINQLLQHMSDHAAASFLDYGFGAGAFLIRLAERGYRAVGMDFGQQNVRQLKRLSDERSLGIQMYEIGASSLDEVGRESFDYLTLFQVVEHLVSPLQAIRDLRSLLKPKGLMYIECPNQEGLFFQLKNQIRSLIDRRNMWGALSPPQHVLGFNRRSLSSLVERAGFDIVELGDFPMADGIHAPESTYWYPTIRTWLTKKEYRTPYGTSKMLIRLADIPASRLLGAGGGLFAIARKRE